MPLADIPRLQYGIACLVAGVVSVVLGVVVARMVGPDVSVGVLWAVGTALAVGVTTCVIPMLPSPVVKPETWGLSVMMASVMRTLLTMGILLFMLEAQGLPRKPVVFGVLAGAFVMMMAEAMVAVLLLSRRDRARAAAVAGGKVASVSADSSVSSVTNSSVTQAGHVPGSHA